MEKIIFNVDGMSCGHCENAVQNAVRELTGVKEVKADAQKKQAAVEYNSSLTTTEEIKAKIEEQGFEVISY